MTATEPTPTDEHTDAVALMLADLDHYRRGNTLPAGTLGAVYRERAVRVLTSTDPAVHAALAASLPAEAMLAALVDRGNDEEIRRRLEWATGRNGLRLLAQIRDEGLDVIRVTPEQVAP